MLKFLKNWIRDFRDVFVQEFKGIFTDGGVLLIFFVGGMGYPLLYNALYKEGIVEDTPVAVVDDSDCSVTRRYIRKVDATRELQVAARCATMEEAERLMQERKVNGILYFPSDFGDKIAAKETAKFSVYADMSSFLYYKNLLLGSEFVMLDEIHYIEIERYAAAGYTDQQISQLVAPVPYEENSPYNKAYSYTIFFLSAALMLVVQQTMFYGMSIRAGTMREDNLSYGLLADKMHGRGMGRIVLGRGAAYWLPYLGIALYIATIVPALFNFPQRGSYWDIVVMLLFYVTACVLFCEFWSSFVSHRETIIVLMLFISPIAMFLTGFSWPQEAFPVFWRYFSYLFPSTFGCRAFINLNSAGGTLSTVSEQIIGLTVQSCCYYLAANAMVYIDKVGRARVALKAAQSAHSA